MGSNRPLGTGGDLRRRLLLHHVPLAFASAAVLLLFMNLPLFDANTQPHADIFSGTFPRERSESGPMNHRGNHAGPMHHGGGHTGRMDHGGDQAGVMGHRSFARQFTFGSGYVALGLLGLTLLIAPANLLLRRRNPVSNYLSRDVGTWAAVGSAVHTIFALQVHGSGRIRDFLNFFVAPDGGPLLNSFGLGNWTGLAALVIAVGLLAISSDFAMRKLKARRWKRIQRLNYALFGLVIAHAFFYGALLRTTSPFTLLLGLSVIAVFVGQGVGIWLWRRRYARAAATAA
jgi:DMSO/TMAO reductase YedYZ heme-binding membrane subunit